MNAAAANASLTSPLTWLPAAGNAGASPSSGDSWFRARQEALKGSALLDQGHALAALDRFHEAVWLAPNEAGFHYMLAGAAEKAGNKQDLVERALKEAVRVDPLFGDGHDALGVHYRRLAMFSKSLHHSATAVALAPRDSKFVANHGTGLFMTGRTQEAWEMIEGMVAGGRTGEPVNRWLAHLYSRIAPLIGHEERALDVVMRAMDGPNMSPLPEGKPLLHFAAAALLDKLGRQDEAFAQARLANEMVKAAKRPYDPIDNANWASIKIGYFTAQRLRALPRATHGNRRPVFIVGMPRSGTSLVEQILACHPEVVGAGELNALREVGFAASAPEWSEGEPYPECFELLSTRRANKLGAKYIEAIAHMDKSATYVTDKMPSNFAALELVELLFPDCKIIHCVRSPLDTCLSCYMTNFAFANEFSYDLAHVGSHYREYRRIMEHWKKVLTVPILDVRYEDLVLDTEGQVRRMLDFLNLPWDEGCLRYYENPRLVTTASEDQVRRPIYTSSIGRWKLYEKHLKPLISALGKFSGSGGNTPAKGGGGGGAGSPGVSARGGTATVG